MSLLLKSFWSHALPYSSYCTVCTWDAHHILAGNISISGYRSIGGFSPFRYTVTGSSAFNTFYCCVNVLAEASSNFLNRTGGAVCKVSYSLARATGRLWVQAPAAFLARLGNKYLLKCLTMWTLHNASVLDKYNQGGLGAVLDSC
jgi:hypothetical protein